MAFRSKLARYNTVDCEQVMPVFNIPNCILTGRIPAPLYQLDSRPCHLNVLSNQSANSLQIGNYSTKMVAPSTGSILTNTTGSLPDGYLLCDGSEVSRITYNVLFLVIGIYYGDGDGSTTFNLPNLTYNIQGTVTYIIKT